MWSCALCCMVIIHIVCRWPAEKWKQAHMITTWIGLHESYLPNSPEDSQESSFTGERTVITCEANQIKSNQIQSNWMVESINPHEIHQRRVIRLRLVSCPWDEETKPSRQKWETWIQRGRRTFVAFPYRVPTDASALPSHPTPPFHLLPNPEIPNYPCAVPFCVATHACPPRTHMCLLFRLHRLSFAMNAEAPKTSLPNLSSEGRSDKCRDTK